MYAKFRATLRACKRVAGAPNDEQAIVAWCKQRFEGWLETFTWQTGKRKAVPFWVRITKTKSTSIKYTQIIMRKKGKRIDWLERGKTEGPRLLRAVGTRSKQQHPCGGQEGN